MKTIGCNQCSIPSLNKVLLLLLLLLLLVVQIPLFL